MKVAFHFNADHEELGAYYIWPIEKAIYSRLLTHRSLSVEHSRIFVGDLRIPQLSCTVEEIIGDNVTQFSFSKDQYIEMWEKLVNLSNKLWSDFKSEYIEVSLKCNICVVCFESIDENMVDYLSKSLSSLEYYLGATEVDETEELHWILYSQSLIPRYRIMGNNLYVFYDNINSDDKPEGVVNDMKKLGFTGVALEPLNLRYSIFDKYHNFKQARRVAEWKKRCGNLLAFIADDVVSRFRDIAPGLGDKLWAALNTFESAETNEQYSQVTATCRRAVQYVTDCIFSPSEKNYEGMDVGANKFRNRLLAYADQERRSEKDIDLVCVSHETLYKQLERLDDLVNKGVHSEVFRWQARRCLLRTILLLDDLISFKKGQFENQG